MKNSRNPDDVREGQFRAAATAEYAKTACNQGLLETKESIGPMALAAQRGPVPGDFSGACERKNLLFAGTKNIICRKGKALAANEMS
jgi:hypothetical protein